jgi:hypothetical protein
MAETHPHWKREVPRRLLDHQLATEGSKACNRKVEVRRNAAKAAGRAMVGVCPAMASTIRIVHNPAYQKVLERSPGDGVGSGQGCS